MPWCYHLYIEVDSSRDLVGAPVSNTELPLEPSSELFGKDKTGSQP